MVRKFCWHIDEAKSLWCPRAHNGSEQRCIADGCMAWRWVSTNVLDEFSGRNETKPCDDKYGFCGLAGDTIE